MARGEWEWRVGRGEWGMGSGECGGRSGEWREVSGVDERSALSEVSDVCYQ